MTCVIPKRIAQLEKLIDGDEIALFMPGFCSGDYEFVVSMNKSGELILKDAPKNVFHGCIDYVVRRGGVNYQFGSPKKYDYKYTCKKCLHLYRVNKVISETLEPCPMCCALNKKHETRTPLDVILWELNYQRQNNI